MNFFIHFSLNNRSTLPAHMQYLTNNRLSPVTFSQVNIDKIIQNLESSNMQTHNNTSLVYLKFVVLKSLNR